MTFKPTFKPFVSVNFCYKCKMPVPRVGITARTGAGNLALSSPFICPNCRRKRKYNGK